MKKVIVILLVLVMCLGLMSCSDGGGSSGVDKFSIGIVQISEHPSLNEIREAFIAELEALGIDADIDYKDAQGESSNLISISQNFVASGKDLIVAIATPSATAAVSATEGTDIPVLFSAVTDPVAAELATDFNNPIENVTGTSDIIPTDLIFDLALNVDPDATRVGLLYNVGEANSVSVINESKELLDSLGIEFAEATVSQTGEIKTAAESLIAKGLDFIFVPIDNTVAYGMELLAEICIDAGIPIYVGADSMVKDGGFATVGVNYTYLGQQTAEMAKEILEGKKASDIPIRTMETYVTVVNEDTALAIGIDIGGSIFEGAEIVHTGDNEA